MSAWGMAAPPVVVKSREAGTPVVPSTRVSCSATRPTCVAVDPAEQAVRRRTAPRTVSNRMAFMIPTIPAGPAESVDGREARGGGGGADRVEAEGEIRGEEESVREEDDLPVLVRRRHADAHQRITGADVQELRLLLVGDDRVDAAREVVHDDGAVREVLHDRRRVGVRVEDVPADGDGEVGALDGEGPAVGQSEAAQR